MIIAENCWNHGTTTWEMQTTCVQRWNNSTFHPFFLPSCLPYWFLLNWRVFCPSIGPSFFPSVMPFFLPSTRCSFSQSFFRVLCVVHWNSLAAFCPPFLFLALLLYPSPSLPTYTVYLSYAHSPSRSKVRTCRIQTTYWFRKKTAGRFWF